MLRWFGNYMRAKMNYYTFRGIGTKRGRGSGALKRFRLTKSVQTRGSGALESL